MIRLASFLMLSMLLLLASGCARPVYLNSSETEEQGPAKTNAGTHCAAKFAISNGCVDIKWEKRPTEKGFGSFIFTTTDSATGVLTDLTAGTGAEIKIVLWMPSMGHGSSPVTVETVSHGIYRASQVFFNMKADWEIRFQIGSDQAVYALFF